MISEKGRSILAKCGLFSASIIWGSSFFILKNTMDFFSINFILGTRFFTGGLILALVFRKRLRQLDLSYIKSGCLIGIFMYLGFMIQTIGLEHTSPGKNAFLSAAYCIMTPFLFWLVSRQRPKGQDFLSAIVCMLGIAFVSIESDLTISVGDGLSVLSGLFYAAQIVAICRYAKEKDPVLIAMVQLLCAGSFGWIGVLFTGGFPAMELITAESLFGLVYLCVFATAFCMTMQNVGQHYASASQTAIILSLESVFGVFFSVLFYGETLTLRLLFGFSLIFIAVIISEIKLMPNSLNKSIKVETQWDENEDKCKNVEKTEV